MTTASQPSAHSHIVAAARDYLMGLQNRITGAIEAKDGQTKFLVDKWEKGLSLIHI